MPRTALRIVLALWVAGFVIGTAAHVADLATAGTAVYASSSLGVRIFWVSLTLFDPAVVVLLVRRRRAGIILGVIVICVDVAVNWAVFAATDGLPVRGVATQSAFGLIVIATAAPLWRWFAEARSTRPVAP